MKNKYLIIKSILGLVLTVLSLANWSWFMLISLDVPPVMAVKDIKIMVCMFALTAIILVTQIAIIWKCKMRESYLVLITGLIMSTLWVVTYHGQNFDIGDAMASVDMQRIIIAGIVISTFSIIINVSVLRKTKAGQRCV